MEYNIFYIIGEYGIILGMSEIHPKGELTMEMEFKKEEVALQGNEQGDPITARTIWMKDHLVSITNFLKGSICHSIEELSNEAEYSHTDFQNLVASLKLPLDHVQESKITFIQNFEALDTVLSKAKEPVMRHGPTCSRIYMATHDPHFIKRFVEIYLDISQILGALPILEQSCKQVEWCIKEVQRARYTFKFYGERTKEDIENALVGHTVCNCKIKVVAGKLELMTSQEILREAGALEMEKGLVIVETYEQEAATRDEINIKKTQEQSQGCDQALSAIIFPLSLDNLQPVAAEDEVFGLSIMEQCPGSIGFSGMRWIGSQGCFLLEDKHNLSREDCHVPSQNMSATTAINKGVFKHLPKLIIF